MASAVSARADVSRCRWSSIFLLSSSLASAYSGGSGTPADPYQIATAQDLIDLGRTEDDYGKSFVLRVDIDLADRVFDRAVIARDFTSRFSGRFYWAIVTPIWEILMRCSVMWV